MGIEFNVDVDIAEDSIKEAFADAAEDAFREYVETEVGEGNLQCDCGSRSFDVETWSSGSGRIEGAAICRDCNDRIELDIDTSDLDELR